MRKLVLVSLDAVFDQDMKQFQESWLGEWFSHAAMCTKVKTVFPALTYPAHTTLVTGCDPASHGIGQNQPFQPDKEAAMRAWYWEEGQVRRETLFQAVRREGGRCASMLWPVTGKSRAIRWNFPEVLALPGENQVIKMLAYGTPGWILHMEIKHGRKRKSIREPYLSDYAVTLARDVIAAHQPELTALHLVDVDEMRHHHGVNSPEAMEGLRRQEARVRALWEVMQGTPGMEDALLAVVSDHGQADVDRPVTLGDALEKAGLKAQVQSNGMSAYVFTKTPEGVESWLKEHMQEAGISHVYDRAELNRLNCVAGPALAVEAAPGVVFADGLPQAKREKATHGFGPGHPAENCLLAVRGRGIREGVTLPEMPMRDVAPTLAGLMGIRLPQAEGKDHSQFMKKSEKWEFPQKSTVI